jgi:hypothetical protein
MARLLLACPFCRQLFDPREATHCPDCDIALLPMDRLPTSPEARLESFERGQPMHPDDDPLRWTHLGDGRGALLLLALMGLGLFFSPWIVMSQPELMVLSGFDLARGRAGWLWAGAVGWFVMMPLLLSRSTRRKMRGARVITATFAALTLIEAGILAALPPGRGRYPTVEVELGWGLYASGLVSLAAIFCAMRFGGRPKQNAFDLDSSDEAEAADPNRTLH